MPKKLQYNQVERAFEQGGCKLLETDYANARHKMRYQCSCGAVSKISWSHFKRGQRCDGCGPKRAVLRRTTNIKTVMEIFAMAGCELLESDFKNWHQHLQFRCGCGATTSTTLATFSKSGRCGKCGALSGQQKRKLDINYVKSQFLDAGCELLTDEYINASTKMPFKCSCGELAMITQSNFRRGGRCKKCKNAKIGNSNRKFTTEEVFAIFRDGGCELVEKEYTNAIAGMSQK